MMCDARLFAPQIARFERDMPIHVCDIGGHDTMPALAGAALAAVPFPRFALAGLSMGGICAMEMVRQASGRVERLALLDTNHLADAPERRPMRDRQIADVRDGRLRQVIVEEMKPHYLAAANRDDTALLDLLIRMAMDLGPDCFIRQSLALRDRPDYSSTLAGYHGDTLVLCGEEDVVCPPERHRTMASLLSNGSLAIVAGAGHLTTLEAGQKVNARFQNWLGMRDKLTTRTETSVDRSNS
jgi:pimeloyl-ACP methyl ester carboxylesterase